MALTPSSSLKRAAYSEIESDQPDPRIVKFDRYAFDLSQFGGGQSGGATYHGREKYIWELIWPPKDAPQSGEDCADLHDRIATPLYPIAFAILAYAFLGPPQTTRQSRTLSLLALIGVVALLRLVGFSERHPRVPHAGRSRRPVRYSVRRDGSRIMADRARAGDRAHRGRVENRGHYR